MAETDDIALRSRWNRIANSSDQFAAFRAEVAALLRATDGQRAGVPEGWKPVPAEPNGQMKLVLQDLMHGGFASEDEGYRALLAAAPTPPDGDAERDRRDAERYRHVRAHGMPRLCPAGFYYHDGVFYPTADAAIDATQQS